MNIQSAINAGLFVQFVANEWNSAGNTTDLDGKPVVNSDGTGVVAGKSYTVQKTIYACDLATDFDLLPESPKKGAVTIGVVAVDDADPTDVVVAIRGTLTILEWLQDGKFFYKPFDRVPGSPLTEDGFTDMYLSFTFVSGTSDPDFVRAFMSMIPADAQVTVTGHSLGSALATLFAIDLAAQPASALGVTLYTLASPRVGDMRFAELFNHTVPNAYRVANRLDVVTKVPPPLMYVHVGDETELIPGLDLKFDLACEHHLTSYFHMLGGLLLPPVVPPLQSNCIRGNPAPSPTTVE